MVARLPLELFWKSGPGLWLLDWRWIIEVPGFVWSEASEAADCFQTDTGGADMQPRVLR